MKKYLLGVVIAGCMTGVDFSYAAEEHSETADKVVETADTTEASSASSIDAYAGWYLGAGLSYQHTTGEALLSDNFLRNPANGLSLIKTNVGRLGGGIVGGYGTFLDNIIYVGGEFTIDITGSRKNDSKVSDIYNQSFLKTRGFVPTLALRLGVYVSEIDSLLYIRGGISFLNNKFESDAFRESISSQRITPIIGIGIEKKVYKTCSVRVEGDYRFLTERFKDGILGYDDTGAVVPDYNPTIKNKTHGYAIRMICVYHF